jgi:hypothetical protein
MMFTLLLGGSPLAFLAGCGAKAPAVDPTGLDRLTCGAREIVEARRQVTSRFSGRIDSAYPSGVVPEEVNIALRSILDLTREYRTVTTEDGRFRIEGIPDGEYRFETCAEGWISVTGVVIISSQAETEELVISLAYQEL